MSALDEAVALAKRFEGLKDGNLSKPGLQPYRDPVGYWTIGWGVLLTTDRSAPRPDITWTPEQADAALQRLMARYLAGAVKLIKPQLAPGQWAAVADFSYNLGIAALRSSTLLKKINRGDLDGAAVEFHKWVYSRGRKLPGLIARRQAEADLFRAPGP